MISELFSIGPISISPFGVMLVLAFFAASAQLRWGFRQQGIGNDDDAVAIVLAAGIGGIVGGKVYYAVLYGDWRLLLNRAGLVWYGSFVVGALAVLWVMRRRRLPGWQTADAAAPALALGYAVGRIGCFLVGDDYGTPTDLPWGVAFPEGPVPTRAGLLESEFGVEIPDGVSSSDLLAVHPTQLYETLTALVIWIIGIRLLRRRLRPGTTTVLVIGLMAIERFSVEFLRAKDDRFFGPLTLAQLISLGVVLLMFFLLVRLRSAASSGEAASAGSG